MRKLFRISALLLPLALVLLSGCQTLGEPGVERAASEPTGFIGQDKPLPLG
jgi:hypothetical protein